MRWGNPSCLAYTWQRQDSSVETAAAVGEQAQVSDEVGSFLAYESSSSRRGYVWLVISALTARMRRKEDLDWGRERDNWLKRQQEAGGNRWKKASFLKGKKCWPSALGFFFAVGLQGKWKSPFSLLPSPLSATRQKNECQINGKEPAGRRTRPLSR